MVRPVSNGGTKTLTSHHEVGTSKVSKTRGTNATPVGSVRAITGKHGIRYHRSSTRSNIRLRNEVDTHLSLRGFDGGVSLAGWNGIALAEELEMVDERLHALLHRSTRWRHELVVVNADGAFGDLVQTLRVSISHQLASWKVKADLVNDPQTLPELLDATHITVVAVTVLSDGDIELNLLKCESFWATDVFRNTLTSSYLS